MRNWQEFFLHECLYIYILPISSIFSVFRTSDDTKQFGELVSSKNIKLTRLLPLPTMKLSKGCLLIPQIIPFTASESSSLVSKRYYVFHTLYKFCFYLVYFSCIIVLLFPRYLILHRITTLSFRKQAYSKSDLPISKVCLMAT